MVHSCGCEGKRKVFVQLFPHGLLAFFLSFFTLQVKYFVDISFLLREDLQIP